MFSALTAVLLLCLLISSAWVQDLSKKCSVGSGHEFLTTPVSNDRIQGQAVSLLAERRRGRLECSLLLLSLVTGWVCKITGESAKCAQVLVTFSCCKENCLGWQKKEVEGVEFVFKAYSGLSLLSAQEINNRFWPLSQSWKSRAWFAQCPVVLSNLMQRENINPVKKPKQNNTAINLKKKMPRVPLYQTEGLLLMGSLKLIFSNVLLSFVSILYLYSKIPWLFANAVCNIS